MGVSDQDTEQFIHVIKENSSYDFSNYSEKSLRRRIDRLLQENKVNLKALVLKLKNEPDFLENVVKEVTVNTTELFRDPDVWHDIRQRILLKLKNKESINIWHAGCSTGQEVYSLAIMLNEMGMFNKCNLYASDLNTDVLDQAKKGVYKYRFNIDYLSNFDTVLKENPYNYTETKDVDYEKYFSIDKLQDKIKMHDFLIEKPIFKKMDLVERHNSFYQKFDIIICRNVLIYFNIELQNRTIDFYHSQLQEGGYLILGKHESLLGHPESKFMKKGKFYRKIENS